MADPEEAGPSALPTENHQERDAVQGTPPQESEAFARCAACRHSAEIDSAAGTFICRKFNMRCDAEGGAIPDDCIEFSPDPARGLRPSQA